MEQANNMTHATTPAGSVAIWGDADAVEFVTLATRLCDGYTLDEMYAMSLTFKAQIDVLRGCSHPKPVGEVVTYTNEEGRFYGVKFTAEALEDGQLLYAAPLVTYDEADAARMILSDCGVSATPRLLERVARRIAQARGEVQP